MRDVDLSDRIKEFARKIHDKHSLFGQKMSYVIYEV